MGLIPWALSALKKTTLLGQATTIDGKLMTLHEHDGVFMIRIAGV